MEPAIIQRLRALVKQLDAQSLSTTEPGYFAVPSKIVVELVETMRAVPHQPQS